MPKLKVNEYDQRALRYAERYGIVTYRIRGNEMTYTETFNVEGCTYDVSVNLDTMREKRTKRKKKRKN